MFCLRAVLLNAPEISPYIRFILTSLRVIYIIGTKIVCVAIKFETKLTTTIKFYTYSHSCV